MINFPAAPSAPAGTPQGCGRKDTTVASIRELESMDWALAAFSWYVANFGSYNATYGSLGAIMGFMVWLWLPTIVVSLGAELDAEMEHRAR